MFTFLLTLFTDPGRLGPWLQPRSGTVVKRPGAWTARTGSHDPAPADPDPREVQTAEPNATTAIPSRTKLPLLMHIPFLAGRRGDGTLPSPLEKRKRNWGLGTRPLGP